MNKQKLIERVSAWRVYRGKNALLRFLNGDALTRTEAIQAKGFECSGGFEDAKSCIIETCPLHPYQPYP
jgi:hypothetical protein